MVITKCLLFGPEAFNLGLRHSTLRETTDAFLTNSHVFKLLFSDETAQCIANTSTEKKH